VIYTSKCLKVNPDPIAHCPPIGSFSRVNYSVKEYANDVVYQTKNICEAGIDCPNIISEPLLPTIPGAPGQDPAGVYLPGGIGEAEAAGDGKRKAPVVPKGNAGGFCVWKEVCDGWCGSGKWRFVKALAESPLPFTRKPGK